MRSNWFVRKNILPHLYSMLKPFLWGRNTWHIGFISRDKYRRKGQKRNFLRDGCEVERILAKQFRLHYAEVERVKLEAGKAKS
jgi:hypothetical protein